MTLGSTIRDRLWVSPAFGPSAVILSSRMRAHRPARFRAFGWRVQDQAFVCERRSHSSRPIWPSRASPNGTNERSSTRLPKYRASGSRTTSRGSPTANRQAARAPWPHRSLAASRHRSGHRDRDHTGCRNTPDRCDARPWRKAAIVALEVCSLAQGHLTGQSAAYYGCTETG